MNKEKKRKIVAIVKLVILGIILIGIPLYIYLFQRELIKELSNFDNIKGYFEAHEIGMVFFCLLAQCIQIVISIIPGQTTFVIPSWCKDRTSKYPSTR